MFKTDEIQFFRDEIKVYSQRDKINMSALFVLIIVSLIVAMGFLVAFLWSVKNGQYDDDYTPSIRMLFDHTSKEINKDKS